MKLSELSPAEGSVRQAYRKGRGSGSGNGKLGLTHSDCKAAVLAKRIKEKL